MALTNAFGNVSTEAKQDDIITAVEAIQAAVETLDDIVSGSEAQVDVVGALTAGSNNIGDVDVLSIAAGDNNIGNVDVVTLPALPAGTNAIGKLAANSGVDIGDVDVTSVPADPFGVNADSVVAAGAAGSIQAKLRRLTTDLGAALTALQLIDDPVFADDAAFTPATSKVMVAGFQADETATDSVDEGDAGAARMTLDRKQIVTVEPHTAGGWATKNCTSSDGATALTNGAQAVKASGGKLGGWYIYNPNTIAQFVCIYNVASGSVTVGTTNPLVMLTIPPRSAANLEMVNGIDFDTAIAVAAASTAGGNGAPSTALDAMFFYK